MRVIVCGSRNWSDYKMVEEVISSLAIANPGLTVIQGGAKGADSLAALVCRNNGIDCEVFTADWNHKGKGAGHIRNRQMLNSGADLVIAFKDDFNHNMDRGGTENMIRIAVLADVPIRLHSH